MTYKKKKGTQMKLIEQIKTDLLICEIHFKFLTVVFLILSVFIC